MEGGWNYTVYLYRVGEEDSDIAHINLAESGTYKAGI